MRCPWIFPEPSPRSSHFYLTEHNQLFCQLLDLEGAHFGQSYILMHIVSYGRKSLLCFCISFAAWLNVLIWPSYNIFSLTGGAEFLMCKCLPRWMWRTNKPYGITTSALSSVLMLLLVARNPSTCVCRLMKVVPLDTPICRFQSQLKLVDRVFAIA